VEADGTQSRGVGWVLGLTSLSFFMVVLDALVVVTALPRIQQDLHVGLGSLQWTVNAYGSQSQPGSSLQPRSATVLVAGVSLSRALHCSLSPRRYAPSHRTSRS
jgi:hypothetical protein